jgi:hypothetical protein
MIFPFGVAGFGETMRHPAVGAGRLLIIELYVVYIKEILINIVDACRYSG